MCGKLIFSVSLVSVLALVSYALAADDPSLVMYYSFDDVDDVVTDQSGKGHDGVVHGDVAADPDGKHNGAAKFAGGGYLDLDGQRFPVGDIPISAMTLAAWVKCKNTGEHHAIFAARSDFDTWIIHPEIRSSGQFRWMLRAHGMSPIFDISGGSVAWDQWVHYAGTYDKESGQAILYINGQVVSEVRVPSGVDIAGDWENGARVGVNIDGARPFTGSMDDFYMFKRALSQSELKKLSYGVGWPYASDPSPADGTVHLKTLATLTWAPGESAISHNVYLGESYEEVHESAAGTFYGNQASRYIIVGAGFANSPYPEGLVPGTTYYWRIDEVEVDGTTREGDVWSFWIPPNTAYDPTPADGAKFIDPNVVLNWTPGLRANLHTIYFGESFDDANNATEGPSQADTTYAPDTLELGKTYYWRVDERGPGGMHKGKVWSFTTGGTGEGVWADYHVGADLENPVLSRTDPQIDFNWGLSGPDEAVGDGDFSARWTGTLEVPISETYSFYPKVQGGVRLWINDQLLLEKWREDAIDERWQWNGVLPVEYHRAIDLEAGMHPIVMEFAYRTSSGGGATVRLAWASPLMPKQVIPQAALSLPVKASRPSPANGAVDVKQTAILAWLPGHYAAAHEVYFGIDEEAVRTANAGSPEYRGTKALGSESYDPGELAWDTTYYWRIDEIDTLNPESPWVGRVWSFTTADFMVVDDFEDYSNISPDRVFQTWIDGVGFSPDPNFPQGHPGNGTGAALGHDIWTPGNPHYDGDIMETMIVHSGAQSAPLYYNGLSEITRTFDPPQDWTKHDIETLSLWFYGDPNNAVERVYVKLNGSPVAYEGDAANLTHTVWQLWNIELARFGVDLSNIAEMSIGLEPIGAIGGEGIVFLDDIRLYHPQVSEALEDVGLAQKDF